MTMTVTVEQIQQVLDEGNEELHSEGCLDLCETNSRNRHVHLSAEVIDEETVIFHIRNAGEFVADAREVEVAVMIFNYYAGRTL